MAIMLFIVAVVCVGLAVVWGARHRAGVALAHDQRAWHEPATRRSLGRAA